MLVEKVVGETKDSDELITGRYLKFKSEQGYSHEEIERKRLSLEGVLVPMTAHFNEEMLKSAGFRSVECFWRWANFCGWVALK
jgi:tRNA (cmo5U34)-methyltransferase